MLSIEYRIIENSDIMGKKPDLTSDEKAQIHAMHDHGLSLRKIISVVPRSLKAIQNCVKQYVLGTQKVRTGRKSLVTDRVRRAIIREVSNKAISSSKVKANLNLSVSARTVRRVIKNSTLISYKKRSRKPILSQPQRARRVNWSRARLAWTDQWHNVIFSDEKKFNLDGPDGNTYYYHDIRKPELLHNKRHSGGDSVMVWGAIGYYGKSDIAFLEGNQNSEKYQATLHDFLLPRAAEIGGQNWIFMQDNAPIHASASTLAWLDEREIEVLPWPARSPDLNPIENVWAYMSSIVYANGKQYNKVADLKVAIQAAWAKVSEEYRQKLYNSMQKRVIEVVQKRGVIINY